MSSVLTVVNTWKDLIIKVFGEYPLAGAIVTILAILLFFHINKNVRKNKTTTNALLILLGWAIAVPILGFVLNVFAKTWEVLEGIVPVLTRVGGSSYAIYDRHPLVVLSLLVLSAAAYFVWKWRWSRVLPSRALRVAVLLVVFVLAIHLANPIADIFSPQSPNAKAVQLKDTKAGAERSSNPPAQSPQLPPSARGSPETTPSAITSPAEVPSPKPAEQPD
jgi:hypothetical protein